jgi:arylsulfatase A-like enzyme
MGTHEIHHPLNRGFDYFYGFLSGGHSFFPEKYTLNDLSEVKRKWDWYRTKLIRNHDRIDVKEGYLTDILTDEAVGFVNRKADEKKPFMLYLAYNAPHTPLEATEKYLSRFKHIQDKNRRTYAAMVSAVDDGVGKLMKTIRDRGLEENTLVFFLSDNGGPLKGSKPFTDNSPFQKGKGSLHEGGIRVPFAVQWKGVIPSDQVYDKPVISLDIMATIVGLSKAKTNSQKPLDGVNLIPFLSAKKKGAPHKQLFWRKLINGGMALRRGDHKLLSDGGSKTLKHQLFDLSKDKGEWNGIKSSHPEITDEMLNSWKNWEKELKDCIFPTLNDVWWK